MLSITYRYKLFDVFSILTSVVFSIDCNVTNKESSRKICFFACLHHVCFFCLATCTRPFAISGLQDSTWLSVVFSMWSVCVHASWMQMLGRKWMELDTLGNILQNPQKLLMNELPEGGFCMILVLTNHYDRMYSFFDKCVGRQNYKS